MKISDWLRGVATVAIADVNAVFNVVRAAISTAPFLPANIKADATAILNDAQNDLTALEGLAGTLAGNAAADAVDDVTTLLLNTANALSNSSSLSALSAAEKTVIAQTWTAMKAQGDTLIAQFMAGIDPTAPQQTAAASSQPAQLAA